MAYFIGPLGNVLPMPGGIGGVEGGMIGALLAFGLPGGRAVVAVLAYRAISFWLPTLPGDRRLPRYCAGPYGDGGRRREAAPGLAEPVGPWWTIRPVSAEGEARWWWLRSVEKGSRA